MDQIRFPGEDVSPQLDLHQNSVVVLNLLYSGQKLGLVFGRGKSIHGEDIGRSNLQIPRVVQLLEISSESRMPNVRGLARRIPLNDSAVLLRNRSGEVNAARTKGLGGREIVHIVSLALTNSPLLQPLGQRTVKKPHKVPCRVGSSDSAHSIVLKVSCVP